MMLDGQCLNDVSPNRYAMAMVFEFFYPTTKTDASKRLWQAFFLKGLIIYTCLLRQLCYPLGPAERPWTSGRLQV